MFTLKRITLDGHGILNFNAVFVFPPIFFDNTYISMRATGYGYQQMTILILTQQTARDLARPIRNVYRIFIGICVICEICGFSSPCSALTDFVEWYRLNCQNIIPNSSFDTFLSWDLLGLFCAYFKVNVFIKAVSFI